MTTSQTAPQAPATDTFPINGTDYIEFCVGNAKQAAALLPHAPSASSWSATAGPKPASGTAPAICSQQDKIRFVFTTAARPRRPIAEHVQQHGDGVRDIAFWVDDAREAFAQAIERGAKSGAEPTVLEDEHGEVVIAAIRTYGDTIHSLVERRNYRGPLHARVRRRDTPCTSRRRSASSTSTTASATSSWAR